jgi:pseudouridine-5'-monophosphatase
LHRDWFALFDIIVTADDPEVAQPNRRRISFSPQPDAWVSPEDCLVFEDSPSVSAAKAAG